jgi:DNA-binding transcriptional regulator YiaG
LKGTHPENCKFAEGIHLGTEGKIAGGLESQGMVDKGNREEEAGTRRRHLKSSEESEIKMSPSQMLQKFRKERGIQVAEFAGMLGVDMNTLAWWLYHGKPPADILRTVERFERDGIVSIRQVRA